MIFFVQCLLEFCSGEEQICRLAVLWSGFQLGNQTEQMSKVKQVCDPETPWILLGPDFLFMYSHLAFLSGVLRAL